MIDHLTAEQEAMLVEVRDFWLARGLDTTPVPIAEQQAIVRAIYTDLLCMNPPPIIVCLDSPPAAWRGLLALLGTMRDKVRQISSQVESQVGSQVGSQVWSQVWSQVESQIWSQIWSQVRSQVWSQVCIYISSFFTMKDEFDFSCGVRLWERGLVAVSHEDKWYLYGNKDGEAQIVYIINKN